MQLKLQPSICQLYPILIKTVDEVNPVNPLGGAVIFQRDTVSAYRVHQFAFQSSKWAFVVHTLC